MLVHAKIRESDVATVETVAVAAAMKRRKKKTMTDLGTGGQVNKVISEPPRMRKYQVRKRRPIGGAIAAPAARGARSPSSAS